jgi:hypothetical protein
MEAIVTIEPTLGEPGLIGYECPQCVYVTSELVQPTGAPSRFANPLNSLDAEVRPNCSKLEFARVGNLEGMMRPPEGGVVRVSAGN